MNREYFEIIKQRQINNKNARLHNEVNFLKHEVMELKMLVSAILRGINE
jgi:hypothetical protein